MFLCTIFKTCLLFETVTGARRLLAIAAIERIFNARENASAAFAMRQISPSHRIEMTIIVFATVTSATSYANIRMNDVRCTRFMLIQSSRE